MSSSELGLPALASTAALTALASWAVTGMILRYATARGMLDLPNQRSSHSIPTPRGGGAAIVAAVLAAGAWLAAMGAIPGRAAIGLLGGTAMVAIIGWIDDRRGLSARVRALVQGGAACWALAWCGGLPQVQLGAWQLPLGAAGFVLAALAIVWCTNLYNFMDGIDGIAGGQALVTGAALAAWLVARGSAGLGALALAIGSAALGFLAWNWAPARIFMGDVGSGALGFLLAAFAVVAERERGGAVFALLLLGAPFLLDATVTLLRRVARGERWHDAHRSHAYQRAVQSGFSHAQVTSAVMAMTALLGALLLASVRRPGLEPLALLAGYLLVGVAYLAIERRKPMYAPTTLHANGDMQR